MRRLQLALREKERDLERLRCILSSNEETITVRSLHTVYTYQTCQLVLVNLSEMERAVYVVNI